MVIKILLVEDDGQFRKVLKEELSRWFPSIMIDEASDGKEAMEKMDSFCPQLVFRDIRLPDESGLQLPKKIRAKCPDTNVVMLTSYDLPEYRQATRERGTSDFFVKGMSEENEITALVESLLEE